MTLHVSLPFIFSFISHFLRSFLCNEECKSLSRLQRDRPSASPYGEKTDYTAPAPKKEIGAKLTFPFVCVQIRAALRPFYTTMHNLELRNSAPRNRYIFSFSRSQRRHPATVFDVGRLGSLATTEPSQPASPAAATFTFSFRHRPFFA